MVHEARDAEALAAENASLRARIAELEAQRPTLNDPGRMADSLGADVAELRDREALFKTLFELAPYACAVTDVQGRNLMVNEAWGLPCGLRVEDGIGRTSEEVGFVIAPESAKRLAAQYKGSGEIPWVELDVSFGQRSFTLLFASRPIQFSGKPARLLVTVDISEQKRAERALRQSEERFRLLLQNSNDIIAVIDDSARLSSIVGPVGSILGFTPEELVGTSGFDWVHPDDLGAVTATFQRTLADPSASRRVEYRARHKDGSWIWVEVVGSNLLSDQAVKGIVLNIRDIAARKKAEAERARLQSQLIQAQKMESVGRLAGGVAHDFNNKLGVILGHAELAVAYLDPASPIHFDLEEIRKAAERSADLTRQLLAFARKQTISPRPLDLNETVTRMLSMLRRLIGEDIRLSWLPGPDTGLVNIDPSQVDQILANLCVNARDAITGEGRLTIETSPVTLDPESCALREGFVPGNYVLLTVSDTGCGMDAEVRSHLFEPFFTTKEMGKGTGLGLATVFGIVKQNNGFIDVYSEPGHGTTFKIYLPRHHSDVAAPVLETTTHTVRGSETILLVEDETAIRQTTGSMLKSLGYAVLTASSPAEAIRLAREHVGTIDLLLTDVVMPEMNGRELAKNLLAIRPGLKHLFVSGYTANVIVHHGVLDEGVNFLEKPFSTELLGAKVRAALGRG